MKKHIISIILIAIAAIVFVLGFIVCDEWKVACNILVFVTTTTATTIEIILAEKSSEQYEEELKKRPIWETMSQEKYDELKQKGMLDAERFYATYEDDENPHKS